MPDRSPNSNGECRWHDQPRNVWTHIFQAPHASRCSNDANLRSRMQCGPPSVGSRSVGTNGARASGTFCSSAFVKRTGGGERMIDLAALPIIVARTLAKEGFAVF